MAASEETKSRQVEIGDRSVTVGRFSTFKALHAGDLAADVLNEVPDLTERLSNFGIEYRAKNTVKLSRAAVELRYDADQVEKISDEAWVSGNGFLELPANPGTLDVAAFILPVAFKAAREKVLELMALVVASNSELREADESGRITEVLDEKKRWLLHADLAEVVDLAVAAADVLGEQFEGKAGKLRAVGARFGIEMAPAEETSVEAVEKTETISSPSKPPTSIASPSRTDGAPQRPSTEPASTLSGSSSG